MTTVRRAAAAAARRASGKSAREAAVQVLARVEAGEAFANLLLTSALGRARLAPSEAGLATELVYGVLRHRARVDWTLAGALHRPLEDLPPHIRAVLRSGCYQLLFLTRIAPHAAVDEAVSLARAYGHPGTAKLVNAVLRRVAAEGERPLPDGPPAKRIAVEHSHPRWLVERWLARFGVEETLALCRANNTAAPTTARVNTLRIEPQSAEQRLRGEGVLVTPTPLAEGIRLDGPFSARHRLVAEGLLTMQDLGAMIVTHVLDPRPGEVIIDAAAAPGGKTTHIAERMRDRGRIIACDIHPGKLQRLSARVAVMGLSSVEAHHLDARQVGRIFPERADRVLLDAPCTGLGVLRRRPEIKWRVQPDHLDALARLQREMLDGAAQAVRPGGVLVYSVCSTEEEEGPGVIDGFLRDHPDFGLEGFSLPGDLRPAGGEEGMVMLLPHRHGTDGFFIARLRRRPGS
ncbi:MAG: 16S rRNA (cytosine(967)-C(5))-methyltransferase RsmB [Armatimonadota bacterium]|nr:16S rRNA (cytosine(967)-C(5))-methyltransferase RsmB [Armatimonadota bacterium]MDR7451794.1 16S rRNA (cytosine(967)-C(5))-methyltransferase RsmB [Armatimonadota bacterium]MDR7467419.1 16S rRNA (cytosine(967)-C(5))-methyltransferase RsmB [Armatimonadota bacterium]MDR7494189.1 16S rRNA (cytosine(967)-C(5))-methyltransferase RsmB [Armatimonadota bacterium]MDR7498845.1 16S rRNA (cytosine(967)-C(5))-methyltransferase RsmB [Armatimonadota bacterium]